MSAWAESLPSGWPCLSSLARTDYPEAHLVYTRSNFPRNLKLHQKGGAEMRSHINQGPGCPFLSWHVCPSTDRQFASQRATDGTLREKGSWQATHLRRRRKSPVFLTFGVQVLGTCFCLNNIKYHIFLLRDSVAVCSFQFSEAYDPGQRSSSMFSRSVLPWT